MPERDGTTRGVGGCEKPLVPNLRLTAENVPRTTGPHRYYRTAQTMHCLHVTVQRIVRVYDVQHTCCLSHLITRILLWSCCYAFSLSHYAIRFYVKTLNTWNFPDPLHTSVLAFFWVDFCAIVHLPWSVIGRTHACSYAAHYLHRFNAHHKTLS